MKIIMKAIITIVPADTAVIGGFNWKIQKDL